MAIALKENGFATHIIGVDASKDNQQKALELHLIDEVLPLFPAVVKADVIILAIPVSACEVLLPQLLEFALTPYLGNAEARRIVSAG